MKAPFSICTHFYTDRIPTGTCGRENKGGGKQKRPAEHYIHMYFFRKKDPNRPVTFNLKVMHWINRIAILLFLAGIIYKIIEWLSR